MGYCKQKVSKNAMNHHISFLCAMRSIKCPFYHFGCHQVIKSQSLSQHLKYNAAQHYQLKVDASINKLDKMKLQIESLLKLNDDQDTKHRALEKQVSEMKKELKLQKMYNANNQGQHKPGIGATEEQQPAKMHAQDKEGKGPDVLFLFGSTKWEETGVFIRRHQLHEERVCYTSLRTKCAIRWNQELMAWLIDRRGLATNTKPQCIKNQQQNANVLPPGFK